VPPKSPLVAAAVLLAACSSGDDEGSAPTTTGPGGCPVATRVVADVVGHAVSIEGEPDPLSCAYVADAEDAAGGRVEISLRPLTEGGFGEVLAEVEQRSGPTVVLDPGDVDGADRGWVATVGRAVQVGAADDERLVLVAVTDPLLDAEAAREVAVRLAGDALSG
jgi:hypothetical protein